MIIWYFIVFAVCLFKVKDDQFFVDERQIIWGEKNVETTIPILPRGIHKFPFR